MESILTSIKKLLGGNAEDEHFDDELIIHINSVFSILTQMGVGPSEGFSIMDDESTWNDFIPNDPKMSMVKTYVYQKVKLIFDPPLSSAVIEAMNRSISELEWRLNNEAESTQTESEEIQNG